MNCLSFVEKAILQDKRNIFTKYEGNLDVVPDGLKSFYHHYNPIDVEVANNGSAIRFFSAETLNSLQLEYAYLNAQFIFATCNGDPIFLYENHVYTCPHGSEEAKWELLSDTFESYLFTLI